MTRGPLPVDGHVHSEWSWDTGGPSSGAAGRMAATCVRALEIGLPGMVFTEHLDLDINWRSTTDDLLEHQRRLLTDEGYVAVPEFDVDGYSAAIKRCRAEFPTVRILTGVEVGQPHVHPDRIRALTSRFDRINGSLHTLPVGGDRFEPNTVYSMWPADEVILAYLDEAHRMLEAADLFEVFCHLDYAVRTWPTRRAGEFQPSRFENHFRQTLRAIAQTDLVLEINTGIMRPWLTQWWAEEGGQQVTFGSDAHEPRHLAAHFVEAVDLARDSGYVPGETPDLPWRRNGSG
ncbi:PHP domain-containing protein [Nocardiopsis tropica]|uniref:PHP domain-containing protein n=1 Tax=Tsukamurella strandjordii TaxID=147577 RepID=UPI0031DCA194